MREKGDKLLQVVMINHLLKAGIFPSVFRVHSDPEGVTSNLQKGHTSSSTLPPSLLTPYSLQRPLPHSHAHILYMHTHTWEHVWGAHSTLSPPSLLLHPHQVIYFHRAASSNLFCVYRPWPDQPLWRNVMFTVRLPPPIGIMPQQIHAQGAVRHRPCVTSYPQLQLAQLLGSHTGCTDKKFHRGVSTAESCYIHKKILKHRKAHT